MERNPVIRQQDRRTVRGIAAAVVVTAFLSSGCVLALVPLLATPVAVGAGAAATATGARTAYYNARDFYDAIDQNDGTRLAEGEGLKGQDLLKVMARGEAAFSRAIQPYGLDTPDYVVLNELRRRGASTQASITRNTGIQSFPSNDQLAKLNERGLVSFNTASGQAKYLLSDKGYDLVEKTRPVAEHVRFQFYRRLSLQERQVLAKLSAKAVAEEDNKATWLAGGILGVNTDGAAEFVLAKNLLAARMESDKILKASNLGRLEFDILAQTWDKPELGLKQIAQQTRANRPEVEAAVQNLVDKGFVAKIDQPSENGPWKLTSAPKGVALQQNMKGQVDSYSKSVFARLTEDERRSMENVLSKMARGVI